MNMVYIGRMFRVAGLSCLLMTALSPARAQVQGPVQDAPAEVSGDLQFGLDLLARHVAESGNIFFSPFSVTVALEMAYEGARGKTAEEMHAVLHLGKDDVMRRAITRDRINWVNAVDLPYTLSVANALWMQKGYGVVDSYKKVLHDVYKATAQELDLASDSEGSRVTINAWVEEQTRQRIRELIPAGGIAPQTRLVLTNAVYFKGKWEVPFEKDQTRPEAFRLATGNTVQVAMMHTVRPALYMEDDTRQMVELPYVGESLVMRIIVPKTDAGAFVNNLDAATFAASVAALHLEENVDLALPKFAFGAFYSLRDDLVALGMAEAFSQERSDFSGITGMKDLYIGDVFHKAWIEVGEEGTEAAAATAVMILSGGMPSEPPPPKVMRADHPFIVIIQQRFSGQILFMGRIADPTK